MLFDSHTHINNEDYSDEERLQLIREIEASDVGIAMDVGFDMPSSRLALMHASELDWCYAVVGIHPHDTKTMTEEMLEGLRRMILEDRVYDEDQGKDSDRESLLEEKGIPKEEKRKFKQNRIKAIGEIGLDFHYDLSPREDQRYWFRRQIRLANELKLPIVIHSREADRETMDILIEEGAFSDERKSFFPPRPDGKGGFEPDPRVDIHCYSGSAEFAKEYMKLGATFGVDGPLTYKNNRKTVEVVETVPLEFIMAETDAPYLTPVPFRGKPNKSPYVEYVVRKIAEIKGISFEEAAKATFDNGMRFFDITMIEQADD